MAMRFPSSILPLLLASGLLPAACATNPAEPGPGTQPPFFEAQDRPLGERAPRTAPCDAMDPVRCLLPWPSNTFAVRDPKSSTGVRVAVDPSSVLASDDPSSLNIADGFSRASSIATAFDAPIASSIPAALDGKGPLRLVLAQHDHPSYGALVPLEFDVVRTDEDESLVLGHPLAPLAPAADYVAVAMDDLPVDPESPGAAAPVAPHWTRVALALDDPESQEEADVRAYHAPTREALARAGIDPEHVVRVWDFTTRSKEDATRRLRAMRDAAAKAVADKSVSVVIDVAKASDDPAVALVVEGRLMGVPSFADADPDKGLTFDEARLPVAKGTRDAPFRVLIPAGTGDYPFVMFGHGMGGSYHDSLFDHELAELAIGKVNFEFYGWTEATQVATFTNFIKAFVGAHHSTAWLMQAVADGEAIQKAIVGVIADALSAPTILGNPNPAAGRRPELQIPIWTGGSLGGTMGLVFTGSAKEAYSGVLNVGGAGWTQFVPRSSFFNIMRIIMKGVYGDDLNVRHAVSMSQIAWDDIDGANWAEDLRDKGSVILVQECIGDPIVPNIGTNLMAVSAGAVQVGAVLSPIHGVSPVDVATAQTAVTQYRVPSTGSDLQIHGFTQYDTEAGKAARDQIQSFLQSVYAQKPVITVPAACVGGSCDFSGGL
jgi:hypothetical protein